MESKLKSPTKTKKGSLVAERTLKTLMLFAHSNNILVSDVAKSLNISLTSAYRIIDTLHEMEFIKRNENRKYSLEPLNIMQLYNMVEHDLRSAARPILKNLVVDLEESIYISVLNGENSHVYIEKEDSSSPFKWSTHLGRTLPLTAGTAGKTHLAYLIRDMDEVEKDDFLSNIELKAYTKNTITNIEDLKVSLNQILEDGYCFTKGEHNEGVVGVAVPIYNFDQSRVAGILGMHMLEAHYSDDKLERYANLLKKGSENISRNIY